MGQQRRYKVGMFDTTYRVLIEKTGEKDETVFGSDSFDEATAQYEAVKAKTKGKTVFLMHRARILKRSDSTK